MDALRDLGELERVAEQDESPRRGAQRERVGEAETGRPRRSRACRAGPVELLAREEPRRARDERDLGIERTSCERRPA